MFAYSSKEIQALFAGGLISLPKLPPLNDSYIATQGLPWMIIDSNLPMIFLVGY